MPEFVSQEYEIAPLSSLQKHPRNANQGDFGAIKESVDTNGFYGAIYAQRGTGYILAGNHRYDVLKSEGAKEAPVIWLDVGEVEAARILLADNRTTRLGDDDPAKLAALLQDIQAESGTLEGTGYDGDALDAILADLGGSLGLSGDVSSGDGGDGGEDGSEDVEPSGYNEIFALREDAQFSSANDYGIPDLLESMLYDGPPPSGTWTGRDDQFPGKVLIHGKHKAPADCAGSFLGFYTDDWKFEGCWDNAVAFMEAERKRGWKAVISPDFSLWRDMPAAIQIWNTFRARWCARYWQACGFKVIPSLNWSSPESLRYSIAGIPTDAPMVAAQCRTTRGEIGRKLFIEGLTCSIEALRPRALLLYGSENRDWLSPAIAGLTCEVHWIPSWTRAMKDRDRVSAGGSV